MVENEKLRNLMLAIAGHPRVKSLGLTKLWKLIYFVDVTALRDLGATITGSEFVKYPHGPVPSRGEKVLQKLRREELIETEQEAIGPYTQTSVTAIGHPDMGIFTAAERVIIERICRDLGGKSAKQLSDISHAEPAWTLAADLQALDPELMFYGRAEDLEGL